LRPTPRTSSVAVVAALLLASPAAANDSAAELAAGGLVLVATDAITMQREDLALSPTEIRVRYEMRNDTGQPVTLRVAFPIPEVPHTTPGGMTTGRDDQGPYNIALRPPTDPNFLGFRVWSNGQELQPEVEIRAELPDGRDIAGALREIGGLPLVLQPGLFVEGDTLLDPATITRLQALDAYEKLDDKAWRLPWTTRITFHWMQRFVPGVTVIEHAYRPVVGVRFIVPKDGGPIEASGSGDPKKDFCIDAPTERAIRELAARKRRATPDDGLLKGYTVAYILRTARNWRGPIGTFHLTLAGGRVDGDIVSGSETRIVSLCTDLPLTRTGPLRFEATVRDYVPKEDLRVLFIGE
jgi:uncharacterized protein DUF4424